MESDATPIKADINYDSEPTNMISEISNALMSSGPEIKKMLGLMFVYVIMNSDLFVNKILGSTFGGAVDQMGNITSYGTLIQACLLAMFYILVVILVNTDLL
jgi:hypothetical protein